jgi:hypothetical protein
LLPEDEARRIAANMANAGVGAEEGRGKTLGLFFMSEMRRNELRFIEFRYSADRLRKQVALVVPDTPVLGHTEFLLLDRTMTE